MSTTHPPTGTLEQAYRICEGITRDQARNFYYGIRLLPTERRAVLCALYALARRIDDIGDGDLPTPQKQAGLAALRQQLTRIGDSSDPVLAAVADAASRYPIPIGAFHEIIDGVEMDVTGRTYPTFDDLVVYCRCVAGAVGRLCLGAFGSRRGADPAAAAGYADALGIALQQTNILRDIREDLLNGRIYLPQDDLDRFGVTLRIDQHGALVDDGRLAALIRFSADRAQGWYATGRQLLPMLDRRSAACCAAMSGIYARLLHRIAAQPSTVYDRRMSLSTWEKAAVAARSLAGTPT
jgi:phytoene synthase